MASYSELGVDLFPNVDLPVVTVTTTLRGASVEEMETSRHQADRGDQSTRSPASTSSRSTTKEGISQVTVQFVLEKNGDVAAQEVRTRSARSSASFQPGTDTPIVDKFQIDASPVMTIAVSGRRDSARSPRSPARKSRKTWRRSTASAR